MFLIPKRLNMLCICYFQNEYWLWFWFWATTLCGGSDGEPWCPHTAWKHLEKEWKISNGTVLTKTFWNHFDYPLEFRCFIIIRQTSLLVLVLWLIKFLGNHGISCLVVLHFVPSFIFTYGIIKVYQSPQHLDLGKFKTSSCRG